MLGVFFFSFFLFFCSDLLYFWMFLELSGLCLVPCLYTSVQGSLRPWREHKIGVSALTYVIVLSISSSLILCGIIEDGLFFLLFVGLLIKFGVFPFSNWVVSVLVSSRSWLVVLCVSTFFKFPILLLGYFVGSLGSVSGSDLVNIVYLLGCFTFVYMSWKFMSSVSDYFECWANMMVSSSAALYCLSMILSLDLLFVLFVVYLIWSLLVITFFGYFDNFGGLVSSSSRVLFIFGFCVLLLATPVSLSLFYKLLIAGCMLSSGGFIFLFWCFNSIVEQWWLMRCLASVYSRGSREMISSRLS